MLIECKITPFSDSNNSILENNKINFVYSTEANKIMIELENPYRQLVFYPLDIVDFIEIIKNKMIK